VHPVGRGNEPEPARFDEPTSSARGSVSGPRVPRSRGHHAGSPRRRAPDDERAQGAGSVTEHAACSGRGSDGNRRQRDERSARQRTDQSLHDEQGLRGQRDVRWADGLRSELDVPACNTMHARQGHLLRLRRKGFPEQLDVPAAALQGEGLVQRRGVHALSPFALHTSSRLNRDLRPEWGQTVHGDGSPAWQSPRRARDRCRAAS